MNRSYQLGRKGQRIVLVSIGRINRQASGSCLGCLRKLWATCRNLASGFLRPSLRSFDPTAGSAMDDEKDLASMIVAVNAPSMQAGSGGL